MYYKLEELEDYFYDFLEDKSYDWIKENWDDLHHHAFNTNWYIIGRHKATKWLGEEVFNVIDYIKDYEQDYFGKVLTDFSEPERVVNMYTYAIGEEIVCSWQNGNYSGYFEEVSA